MQIGLKQMPFPNSLFSLHEEKFYGLSENTSEYFFLNPQLHREVRLHHLVCIAYQHTDKPERFRKRLQSFQDHW